MKTKILSNFSKQKDGEIKFYRSNDMNIEHELKMRTVIKVIEKKKENCKRKRKRNSKPKTFSLGNTTTDKSCGS